MIEITLYKIEDTFKDLLINVLIRITAKCFTINIMRLSSVRCANFFLGTRNKELLQGITKPSFAACPNFFRPMLCS